MVDADYYGYRDEDDGIIVPLEQEREKEGTKTFPAASLSLNLQPFIFSFSLPLPPLSLQYSICSSVRPWNTIIVK